MSMSSCHRLFLEGGVCCGFLITVAESRQRAYLGLCSRALIGIDCQQGDLTHEVMNHAAPESVAAQTGIRSCLQGVLGFRGGRESPLGSQPTANLLDRLVGLGYTAGAQDERVLPVRNRVESDVQRRAFRAVGELDRLTGQ